MHLYLISKPSQKTTLDLLTESASKQGVSYSILDPSNTGLQQKTNLQRDAVYRISDIKNYGCLELEYQLIKSGITTFYKDNNPLLINLEESDSLLFPIFNVSSPFTWNYIPEDRDMLIEVVESLGGFPLIIKVLGGSHGVGIIRVDSYESLYSLTDYLISTNCRFVLKQYIDVKSTARLIVLGDNVVDSIEYTANKNDFRSNEGHKPNVRITKFDKEIQALAIKAVDSVKH